ncbi:MAG TPA: hypothetical protein VGN80_19680 [Devosiaceae bacterium]|jgi:heme A synthase|nr:hypothetical protein [Devosiaceae bacterium]
MAWNKWIRQGHRWLGMILVATVIVASFAAATGQREDSWLFYLPLPPLFLLMFTGVYMFILPYLSKWRGGRRASEGT